MENLNTHGGCPLCTLKLSGWAVAGVPGTLKHSAFLLGRVTDARPRAAAK